MNIFGIFCLEEVQEGGGEVPVPGALREQQGSLRLQQHQIPEECGK
jgi:hypothetical protein